MYTQHTIKVDSDPSSLQHFYHVLSLVFKFFQWQQFYKKHALKIMLSLKELQ